MSYKIYRHPEVEQDLFDIVDLIAEYAGVLIAMNKLAEIEATILSLVDMPHVGTIRDEIAPNLRAIPTARKGVITFTVDDAERTVLIISITYAGANWLGRMPARL